MYVSKYVTFLRLHMCIYLCIYVYMCLNFNVLICVNFYMSCVLTCVDFKCRGICDVLQLMWGSWYLLDFFSLPILRVQHHRHISLINLTQITGNMAGMHTKLYMIQDTKHMLKLKILHWQCTGMFYTCLNVYFQ